MTEGQIRCGRHAQGNGAAHRGGLRRVLVPFVLLGVVLGACSDDGVKRDDAGRVTKAAEVAVFDLRVGDCLNPPDEVADELLKVQILPCTETHTQEIVGIKTIDTEDYPGDAAIQAKAEQLCLDPFSDYVGVDYVDSSLYLTYLLPSLRSWDDGDQDVTCIAQVIDAAGIKQSIRNSER